jgi:hypothetical protein
MSDPVIAEPNTEPQEPEVGATPEPVEELGKPGLAALQAERDARKAAETRLKEFEDRDKTEAQKQHEALEAAKAELAELTTAKTRAEVAAAKTIPTTLLAGPASNSAEDLSAFADALIAYRGEPSGNRLHVPNEGSAPPLALNSDGIEGALRTALGIV